MLKYTIFILLCLSLFSCKKELELSETDRNQPYYPDIRLKEVFRMNHTDIVGETDPYFSRIFSVDTFLIIRTSKSIQVRSIKSMELLWTVSQNDYSLVRVFDEVAMIDNKLVLYSQYYNFIYDPTTGQLLQQIRKQDFMPATMRSSYLSRVVRNGTNAYFTHVNDISLTHYIWTLYHHDLQTNVFTPLHRIENARLGSVSDGGIYRPMSISEDGKRILLSLNILENDVDVSGIYLYNTESNVMKRIYDESQNLQFSSRNTNGLISGNRYYFLDVRGNLSGIRFDDNSAEKLFGITPGQGSGYDDFTSIEMHNDKYYGINRNVSSIVSFDAISGKYIWANGRNYLTGKTAFVDGKNLIFSASYKNVGNKRQYCIQLLDLNDGQVLVEEFPPMEDGKESIFSSIIYSPAEQSIIVQNHFNVIKYELPELFK